MAGVGRALVCVVFGAFVGSSLLLLSAASQQSLVTDARLLFGAFTQRFKQNYSSADELTQAWSSFQASLKRQFVLNTFSGSFKHAAKYGVTRFSGLTPEQFKELYLRARPYAAPKYNLSNPRKLVGGQLPPRFDWRDHGAIGPIQNQHSCGACWAFSVVAAVAAVRVKDGGTLENLSVQQVIDCDYRSNGCNGGSTVTALDWLKQSKEKLVNETEYPYKGVTGACQIFPRNLEGVSVRDYAAYDFSEQEDMMMECLLEWGPLVVIVDATAWQDYMGGVIQHHCSRDHANHAVLITGYDTTGDVPYWIVRNSWGESWGDRGYVYIKIGQDMCGIADSVAAVFL